MYIILGILGDNIIFKVIGIENIIRIDFINKYKDYRKVNNKHYLDTSNNDIIMIDCLRPFTVINNIFFRQATQFEFDRWQFNKMVGSNGLEYQKELCDNALIYKVLMGIS